jgi:UDP-glucose 4-epimerase
MTTVLLTGGTGFIGSHTCVELMTAGVTPVLLDNLSNSSAEVVSRIEAISRCRPAFVEADSATAPPSTAYSASSRSTR